MSDVKEVYARLSRNTDSKLFQTDDEKTFFYYNKGYLRGQYMAYKDCESHLDEFEDKLSKLTSAITYALAQEDNNYGMEPYEAHEFRERKVFSILREALEDID